LSVSYSMHEKTTHWNGYRHAPELTPRNWVSWFLVQCDMRWRTSTASVVSKQFPSYWCLAVCLQDISASCSPRPPCARTKDSEAMLKHLNCASVLRTQQSQPRLTDQALLYRDSIMFMEWSMAHSLGLVSIAMEPILWCEPETAKSQSACWSGIP
jgi:hypothetical protein